MFQSPSTSDSNEIERLKSLIEEYEIEIRSLKQGSPALNFQIKQAAKTEAELQDKIEQYRKY